MSFRGDRLPKEQAFLDKLRPALEALGIRIAPNGAEYTHGDFMEALRQSDDLTALALRFQPDLVCYLRTQPSRPFYVEAKAGDTIERNAYEQYRRLVELGHIIAIVFEPFDSWRWNFVEMILLRRGSTTVNGFPPEHQFAVEDEWIMPRKSPHWEEIRHLNPQASGTPYREVLRSGLRPWADFLSGIQLRLRGPAEVYEQPSMF